MSDFPREPGAPFMVHIGAVLEEKREGYARLSLTVGPQHTNLFGYLHGGVLTAIMDSAIGIGLGRLRGEESRRGRPHATIEMNASFLTNAAPGDEIVAEGQVIRLGRTVAFGESEARRRSDGKVLAKARLTFAIGTARSSGRSRETAGVSTDDS